MSDTHADEHVEEEDESLSTFRRRLEAETERLTGLCTRWEVSLEDDLDIPNDLQVIHIRASGISHVVASVQIQRWSAGYGSRPKQKC